MSKSSPKFLSQRFLLTSAIAMQAVLFVECSQLYASVHEENIEAKELNKNVISDEEILKNIPNFEKVMTDGLEKIKFPGATLSISRANKVLYFKAFGKTAMPGYKSVEATPQTLFSVSSVSKNISAILVGALVDAGKISFSDKVRKYYPEFFMCNEALSNEFTVQDLISHSSGLKHFSGDSLLKAGYDNAKILNAFRFFKQRPGEYRKYYGYQNIVYGIIGIVLEKATGEKYEDLVQKYIFDKMAMKNSSAIRLDAEASKLGYFKYLLSRFSHDQQRMGLFKAVWNLFAKTIQHKSKVISDIHTRRLDNIVHLEHTNFYHKFPATSGISLSAEDFAKWLAMLANKGTYKGKQIVSEHTFNRLTSDIVTIKDIKDEDVTFVKSRFMRENMHYGMGFFNAQYADNGRNARKIYFHMGGIRGSTAFLSISPSDDIAVGVSCNLGGVAMTRFSEYAVNAVLDLIFKFNHIDWVQEDIDKNRKFREKNKKFWDGISHMNPTPMDKTEKYVGTYTSEMYGNIRIYEKDDLLYLSNGNKTTSLKHINGDVFAFPGIDLSDSPFAGDEYVIFLRDENRAINSCIVTSLNENDNVFVKRK